MLFFLLDFDSFGVLWLLSFVSFRFLSLILEWPTVDLYIAAMAKGCHSNNIWPTFYFWFSNSDTLSQLQSIRICACPFCYITKNFAYLDFCASISLSPSLSLSLSLPPDERVCFGPICYCCYYCCCFFSLLFLLLHLSHCLDRLSELLFRNLNLFIPFKFVHNLDWVFLSSKWIENAAREKHVTQKGGGGTRECERAMAVIESNT